MRADLADDAPAGAVTSLSWIPSELISGPFRVPFDVGLTHYDAPPPDALTPQDVETLRRAGRFRFVNALRVRATTRDGRLTGVEPLPGSGGVIGRTNLLGGAVRFPAIAMPDLLEVDVAADGSRVVVRQTAGGRAPLPAPRLVRGRPRLVPPLVWTTLELTLRADGPAQARVVDASDFPRHWVYDAEGRLAEKVATTAASRWLRESTEAESPWGRAADLAGGTDPEAPRISGAGTELERRLSVQVMRDRPRIERLAAGAPLFRQGETGTEVALVLDGVVAVERDGELLTEIGPGAVLGERALLEGARTSTVTAVTPVVVALVDGARMSTDDLAALVEGHRNEDPPA